MPTLCQNPYQKRQAFRTFATTMGPCILESKEIRFFWVDTSKTPQFLMKYVLLHTLHPFVSDRLEYRPFGFQLQIPNNFAFQLYDLDWTQFPHLRNAIHLVPDFATVGIKSTVCGPESFTPDHKPLLGIIS